MENHTTSLKFSIVTCTRNSAATLAKTIDSVQSQTGVKIEHVFVDGASNDATLDLCRAVPGEKKTIEGVTGGISKAMNRGVAEATGDIVAHLHSDDYYFSPRVLATVARQGR